MLPIKNHARKVNSKMILHVYLFIIKIIKIIKMVLDRGNYVFFIYFQYCFGQNFYMFNEIFQISATGKIKKHTH